MRFWGKGTKKTSRFKDWFFKAILLIASRLSVHGGKEFLIALGTPHAF